MNREPAPREPHASGLGRDELKLALGRGAFNRQFAAIVALVATFQISLVTYASQIPRDSAMDLSALEGWSRVSSVVTLPPLPPLTLDRRETSAPSRSAPSSPVAPKAPVGRRDLAPRTQSGGGLLTMIGSHGRAGGALHDVFEDGALASTLDSAFDRARGIDIARTNAATRGDFGVGVGTIGLEGTGVGQVTLSGKTEVIIDDDGETKPGAVSPTESGDVARALRAQIGAIRACYESALKHDPTLAGKLVLRLEIDRAGRTRDVSFEDDTLGSPAVTACLERRASAWRFPAADRDSITVTYPLLFAPAAN